MRHALGPGLQGGVDDGVAGGLVVAWLAPTAGGNLPNLADPQIPHSFAPQVHRGPADLEAGCHRLILFAGQGPQDDPATKLHLLGSAVGGFPLFELALISRTQHDGETRF